MKIWIIGAGGQLGKALVQRCRQEQIPFTASTRKQIDISNLDAMRKAAKDSGCSHLINCAAFTDVDGAESKEKEAYAVNAHGAEHAAIACKEAGIKMVHISTDYVFDGTKQAPYTEQDTPRPINVYGKSKLEGEWGVLKHCPTACIVRTSWIFGQPGMNFVSSVFDLVCQKTHVSAVDDQISRVTYNRDLADALIDLCTFSGIYHFANRGEVSRYAILKECFLRLKEKGTPIACQTIASLSSEAFPTVSRRPLYSVLSTDKLARDLGRKPRVWKTAFNEYLDQIYPDP